jgi:aminoglycoside phosphotransferase (APT) family kinase protein
MGNLICSEQRVQAVLDWELACCGNPMQDLGWLCVRTWRFCGAHPVGGIGQRADLFAAYERASGMAVDPAQVRFWEVWGSIRWAVMCLIKALAHRGDGSRPTVESLAIGRRMEEPLFDFLEFLREGSGASIIE